MKGFIFTAIHSKLECFLILIQYMSFSFCIHHVGETAVKLNIYFPTIHSECECSKSPPLGRTILAIAQPPGLAKMAQAQGWSGGDGTAGIASIARYITG